MNEYRLSIDYGTTNTVAYLQPPDGDAFPLLFDREPLLPSAVFAPADRALLTGREAVYSAGLDPGCFEPNPKRRINEGTVLLGDEEYPVADLIGATLARVLSEARNRSGGAPLRVVLTYPAAWSSERRTVLRSAAGVAHINQPQLVTEPEAAAAYLVASGHSVPDGVPLVVYDLGAGTCDVSAVLRSGHGFDRLDCAGLDDVGGLDLDEVVLKRIGRSVSETHTDEWARLMHPEEAEDRRYARLLREEARLVKERLSTMRATRMLVPLVDQDIPVKLSEFERDARPLLARTVEVTAKVLRRARVGPDDPAELFMVGGATRTPLVGVLLGQSTGRTPRRVDHPEQVVAAGALRHLAMAGGEVPRPRRGPASSPSNARRGDTKIETVPLGGGPTGGWTAVDGTAPGRVHDGDTVSEPVPGPGPSQGADPTVRAPRPDAGQGTAPRAGQGPAPRPVPPKPAGTRADYRKFVPNPQRHLGATLRSGALLATGLLMLTLFDGILLSAAAVLATVAGLAGLAVKIFDWVRCLQDTRPITIDPAGILVSRDGIDTLFPWSEIATVYLRSHRGSRWLVCTPASNSRIGGDVRSRRFWAQPYGLFLLTSVSGFAEQDVRDALDRYARGRYRV